MVAHHSVGNLQVDIWVYHVFLLGGRQQNYYSCIRFSIYTWSALQSIIPRFGATISYQILAAFSCRESRLPHNWQLPKVYFGTFFSKKVIGMWLLCCLEWLLIDRRWLYCISLKSRLLRPNMTHSRAFYGFYSCLFALLPHSASYRTLYMFVWTAYFTDPTC